MEEEKARQEAVNKGSSETGGSSSSAMATDAPKSASAIEGDEDVMLAKALAMSMGKTEDDDVKMTDLTEEDQIARAIELSMSAGGTAESTVSIHYVSDDFFCLLTHAFISIVECGYVGPVIYELRFRIVAWSRSKRPKDQICHCQTKGGGR